MNTWYFIAQLVILGCSALVWCWMAGQKQLFHIFPDDDAIPPALVANIAIFLAFFVGFAGADMREQARSLRHFAQEEANQARSVLKFTEGAGISADQFHEALIEYMQAATTTERSWIATGSSSTAPAQPMADALVLAASVYAMQGQGSDILKSLLVNAVERLRQARVSRLGASRQSSSLAEWLTITVLTLIAQAMLAFALVGKRRASIVMHVCFTATVVCVYVYLAWVDALIGASKATVSISPLEEVLTTAAD